jgi:hypothetical protein
VTGIGGEAHRGVVFQHRRHRGALLVGNHLLGVAGDVERRIHHIAVAQQTQTGALGHLALPLGQAASAHPAPNAR